MLSLEKDENWKREERTESIIKTSKKNHSKRHCKVTERNLI